MTTPPNPPGTTKLEGPQATASPSNTPGAELPAIREALAVDYEVYQELGRGGMAVVYRAKERALEREVAIKVLPASMSNETETVERFEREARTAGQLEHPNIVPIYRVGRAGPNANVIFFVMKMLRGQSLSAVLRGRGRLSVSEIRQILEQTAGALGFASKRGVVHRDIKPDNILLDDEGRCVVTDFGIAKTTTGPHTQAGTSMGTPRYMSPEHAQGTPVDVRSDIYSLGVVAYQCLTGTTPFDADNPFAILYKHINDTLPRPQLTTPEEWQLYAIIEKMLAKKPGERYQSADELLTALGAQVSSPTLTAAVNTRISAMVKTEMITNFISPSWIQRQAWYQRIEMFGARYGVKVWQMGAAAGGVLVVLLMVATFSGGDAQPAPDSTASRGPSTSAGAASVAPAAPTGGAGATTGVRPVAADSGVTKGTDAKVADTKSTDTKAADAKSLAAKAADAKTKAASTQPRPRPAAREAFSRCPATGSAALTRMAGEPVLMLDSIPQKNQGDTVGVNYDVCGLRTGTAFTTELTLVKIRQSRFRRAVGAAQDPVRRTYPDAATSPRTRRTRSIPLAALSGGTYRAEVIITDAQGRKLNARREFVIIDR